MAPFHLLFVCFLAVFASAQTDPCMPGGKWDPLLHICAGYKGRPCFGCFIGPMCKTVNATCQLESQGGDPMLFQEYWEQVHGNPIFSVTADYRTAYQFDNKDMPIAPLEHVIRSIHDRVGNARTDNHEIVLCIGGTQCNAASMYAFAALHLNDTEPLEIYAQTPFYSKYPWQAATTIYVDDVTGKAQTMRWNAHSDTSSAGVLEYVTHPNNPDGVLRQPLVMDKNRQHWDCVYNWPHFTNVSYLDENVMVFSASKLTGHAGSRLGWALVKNATYAAKMREFVKEETLGVPIDSQLRLLDVLSAVDQNLDHYFAFTRGEMTKRFEQLLAMFESRAAAKGYILVNREVFNHGGYAWIRCPRGYNCYELFADAGLLGLDGSAYGATSEYLRLCMMMRSIETVQMFAMIEKRLHQLALPACEGRFAVILDGSGNTLPSRDVVKLGC